MGECVPGNKYGQGHNNKGKNRQKVIIHPDEDTLNHREKYKRYPLLIRQIRAKPHDAQDSEDPKKENNLGSFHPHDHGHENSQHRNHHKQIAIPGLFPRSFQIYHKYKKAENCG